MYDKIAVTIIFSILLKITFIYNIISNFVLGNFSN
jgi:hypothetical protein